MCKVSCRTSSGRPASTSAAFPSTLSVMFMVSGSTDSAFNHSLGIDFVCCATQSEVADER